MVLFKIAGGEIVPKIEMSLLDTISDLKQRIKKELDVEVHRQSLWHKNRKLRDRDLVHDYGFGVSETLYLTVTPLSPQHKVSVLVKFVGGDGYVKVTEKDNVSVLRGEVETHWGIDSEHIILKCCDVVMEDHLPLSSYYVNEDSEVQLSVEIEPR